MQQHLDPVTVAIYALSPLLGQIAAEFAGPYAVIILGSTLGAAWALGRRDPDTKISAVIYFARLIGTAILIAWGLAAILSHYTGLQSNWLLAPVAMLIGGIGDDWPRVGRWLLTRIGRIFERRTDSGSKS
ncbi:hypothetical protein D8I35_09385 [Corticibacter populi]|uniref:Uncharacterized protein n=1 Tax=Corticibacter populi TaxID=1550736 RepID=A0A3M6QUR5_9BURK|nr:hypothetical protein [Corticibacter populi]RMX06703.1 hypothetical protein D8I35_09385 [Corticibacter populi]RZS31716.1 hypothetical protein EV687_2385 [Corticibacter populi]